MEQNDLREVLVVRVPACTVEEAEAIRLAAVRSIRSGVWVIPTDYAWSLEELPCLVEAEQPPEEEKPKPKRSGKSVRKKEIHARLLDYRKHNGLGCLEAVAKAARRKDITADVLRRVISDADALEDVQWAAVGRALDKLEKRVEEESRPNGEDHG